MDTSRLSVGDRIAGASGVALLIVMFLPWYGVDADVGGFSFSESASAWEVLSVIDVLLFLVAAAAIAHAVAKAASALPPDLPAASLVAAAGGLAVLLVLFRIIDLPTPDVPEVGGETVDYGRKLGVFLGLIGSAGIAYGGWRSATVDAGTGEPPQPPPPSQEEPQQAPTQQ